MLLPFPHEVEKSLTCLLIWKLLYGWFSKWEIKMKLCFTALILQEKKLFGNKLWNKLHID